MKGIIAVMGTKHGQPKAFLDSVLASTLGETNDCILWPFNKNNKGYGSIKLDGKTFSVHGIVCEHFHGPRPLNMIVCHSHANNKNCCNPVHLRWDTPAANSEDRIAHGTLPRGESHGMARLTDAQIAEIRQRYATEKVTYTSLAREYGVQPATIGSYINNKSR